MKNRTQENKIEFLNERIDFFKEFVAHSVKEGYAMCWTKGFMKNVLKCYLSEQIELFKAFVANSVKEGYAEAYDDHNENDEFLEVCMETYLHAIEVCMETYLHGLPLRADKFPCTPLLWLLQVLWDNSISISVKQLKREVR